MQNNTELKSPLSQDNFFQDTELKMTPFLRKVEWRACDLMVNDKNNFPRSSQ
jgi:hypothetical protein